MASVCLSHTGHQGKKESSPLEKELVLNRPEVHFKSDQETFFAFIGKRTIDLILGGKGGKEKMSKLKRHQRKQIKKMEVEK